MRLSWNTGYEDYTDGRNWLPRLRELQYIAQTLDPNGIMDEETLFNSMEQVEELMRYYCATEDMAGLEPAMRLFARLLDRCRGSNRVEAKYLHMVFLRINGMLYRMAHQNRQSAENYDRCLEAARSCFEALKWAGNLDDEQLFYVGWNCAECFKEAAEVHDLVLDMPGAAEILGQALPILEWLDGAMSDYSGISEKASELYQSAASALYQTGDIPGGDRCYREAARLLNDLDERYGSDFFRARAIWIGAIHGIMAYMMAGNPNVMLQCEQEAGEFLLQRPWAQERDKAIAEAARSMVVLQKSTAFQQNGQLSQAISMAKEGIRQLGDSKQVLEADCQGRTDSYAMILRPILARTHNTWVGAKESLAVMLYQNDEPEEAQALLKEVLELANDKSGFHVAGSAAVLLQSEVLQYLSLIASDEGNGYEADFYGTQAADMALTLAQETGNPNAWVIALVSCSIVSEVSLNMRNKPKAAKYADIGLAACDALERINPQHPHLALKGNLVKFRKKASRKFF